MTGVAHLAGAPVQFNSEAGPIVRQRCSWCGTVLIDTNLARIAVPVGQADDPYPTWEVGAFIETHSPDVCGGMWTVAEWDPDSPVPENACMRMNPEFTA